MKGFLVSQLVRQYSFTDLESFRAEHPHEWLVWEPGSWRPPSDDKSTIYIPLPVGAFGKGRSEPLAYELVPPVEGALTLGRGATCDISINDGTLSQQHLVLTRGENGRWSVKDAGSRNGTLLNRLRLQPGQEAELIPGAQLEAAGVNLAYYSPEGMLERIKRGPPR